MKNNRYTIGEAEAQAMIGRAMKAGWLLWIKCSSWGNRKKLARDLLEEKFQEDAKAISAVQKLLDSEAVARVTGPMRQAQSEARRWALPWFHDGIYYVLEVDRERLDNYVKERFVESQGHLEWLVGHYGELKEQFRKENPNLYNPKNYPSVESLRLRFNMQWGWQKIILPMGNEDVKVVGKEVVDRENRKFQEMMKTTAEETIVATRNAFLKIVTHLRDSLKDGKKFNDSTVEKPKEFLKRLKAINLYGDKPFEEISSDISEILNGVYGEDLRGDDAYRGAIGGALGDIVEVFKELPTVKLERSIDF